MPAVDIRTLLLTIALANLALAVLLVPFSRTHAPAQAGRFFFFAKLFQASGWGLLWLRGTIPDSLSLLAGNLILLTGFCGESLAVLAFLNRRTEMPLLFLYWVCGGAAWIATQTGAPGPLSPPALASFLLAPLFLMTALTLTRNRPSPLRRSLALLNMLAGATCLLRGAITAAQPALTLLSPDLFQETALAAMMAVTFANGIGYLLMAKEEDERALRDSHERLRRSGRDLDALLDTSVDVFYRTNADGRITMLSRSVETVLGYRREEVLGRRAAEFHHDPESRIRLIEAFSDHDGTVSDFELRMRHSNGHPVWVATSSRLLRDEHGDQAGSEGVFRSIDERRKAALAMEKSRAQIQALLNASKDATLLISRDGTLLAANAVFAARFGHTVEETVGRRIWDMLPPEVGESRRRMAENAIARREPVHLRDTRNGRHYATVIHPVVMAGDPCDTVAMISRDITETMEADRRIAAYIEEIKRSNSELEQFAFIVSHDLREPLRMVSSFLSLLERRLDPHLDPESRDFIAFARDGARRMDRMVLDLLDYARVGQSASFTPVVLDDPVQTAIANLRVAISEANAVISLPTDWPCVNGDRSDLARLFQNLIGNAVKFRIAGRTPRIEITWKEDDDSLRVEVRDNGIGFAPENGERIFGIFQRLVRSDQYEGTGIGLALCRKIVEKHGGKITVASRPGDGATFIFTLIPANQRDPLKPASAPVRATIAATVPPFAASQALNSATISGAVREDSL